MHNTHTHPTLEKNYGINKFKAAIAISVALVSVVGSSAVLAKKCTNKNTTYTCTPLRRTLCNFDYYVGVDAMRRNMHYEKNLGSNFMKKNVPEINLFWGVKFNEHFGMEIGYGVSETTNSSIRQNRDDTVMGYTLPPLLLTKSIQHEVKEKTTNINAKFILSSGYLVKNARLFISAGLKFNNTKMYHSHIEYHFYGTFKKRTISLNRQRKYFAPTIGTGIMYNLSQNVTLRASAEWQHENRRFINAAFTNKYAIKAKNKTSYGIGIIYFI